MKGRAIPKSQLIDKLQQAYQQVAALEAQHEQIAEKLRLSEAYQNIAQYSVDMISKHTPAGIYQYVSPACWTLLGYETGELIDHSTYEFLHPDDMETVKNYYLTILEQPVAYTISYRIRHQKGHYVWFETTGQAIRNPETGQVEEIIAVSRNINKRKQATEGVPTKEAENQALLNAMPQLICRVNQAGLILDVKGQLDYLLPMSPHKVVGKAITDLFPAEITIRLEQHMSRIWQTSETQSIEYKQVYRNQIIDREAVLVARGLDEILVIIRDITERKQAESLLRQSEMKTTTIFLESVVAIAVYDKRGDLLHANLSALDIFGVPPENESWKKMNLFATSLLTEDHKAILAREGIVRFESKLDIELMERLGFHNLEETETKYLHWIITSLINVGYLVQIQDITKRVLAEEQLKAQIDQQTAVAQLRQTALVSQEIPPLLEQAVELVAQSLQVDYCQILELLPEKRVFCLRAGVGWPADLIGQVTLDANSDSLGGYILSVNKPVIIEDLSTETRFQESTLIDSYNVKSGLSVVIHNLTQPYGLLSVYTTQHRQFTQNHVDFLQAMANVLAITIQRQQAMEAMKQNEIRLRSVVQNAVDGIITIDAQGLIESFNPAAEKIFGYSASEIIGQNVSQLMPFPYREEHNSYIINYLQTGQAKVIGRGREVTGLRKDGRTFTLDLAVSEFQLGDRQLFMGIVRDITDRSLLEAELRQAQKMEAVGRLASGVAHDFNNYLTIITSYSEFLLNRYSEQDPQRQDIEQIKKASERAINLTRQLLAFSRKQPHSPRVLKLNQIVTELSSLLHHLLGKNVDLDTQLATDLFLVKIDAAQMEHVLVNLAVNARDAMPQGGQLTIRTQNILLEETLIVHNIKIEAGRYVELAVRDTGSGMSHETLSRLFEPFFTTKERGKGTGLGLSTAYGIIKQSGGHIWAESQPGQGTTFKIYLPQVE